MICSIHQPNFLPYLGFFEKAFRSDIFILYDTTQFKKNDWQNRNKICTLNGWQWISMPVIHNFGQKITEVSIKDPDKSPGKTWRTLQVNYGKSPYYKKYAPDFENIFLGCTGSLNDLNCSIIVKASEFLGLKTRFIKSSELPHVDSVSTQALIDLTKLAGADKYISGADGVNYLDMDLWNKSGLELEFQNYKHPVYTQFNNPGFQPYMNILDLLFNCGEKSLQILISGN